MLELNLTKNENSEVGIKEVSQFAVSGVKVLAQARELEMVSMSR